MPRTFNYERAAAALVDAILMGDDEAAKKYGIAVRSIENWRARLATDDVLVELFQKKRTQKDAQWAHEIPATLSALIGFAKEFTQVCDKSKAENMEQVVKAIETISDVAATWKVMDERLRQAREEAQEAG